MARALRINLDGEGGNAVVFLGRKNEPGGLQSKRDPTLAFPIRPDKPCFIWMFFFQMTDFL
jgi:hypothetical protein